MLFDPVEFRKVLGQFATGVTLVTTVQDGAPAAMTVNSFSAVSLDPPLVLFCADRRSRTSAAIEASGVFAVNILREQQRDVSDLFAGKGTDIDRQAILTEAHVAESGSPILKDVLAFIDCKVEHAYDGGDHIIYVGRVLSSGRGEAGAPLLYYRGTYQALDDAWRWRDRYAAKEQATPFHELVDFFDRMQAEGPYATLIDELVTFVDPGVEDRCLDLGCGTGRLTREMGRRCHEAIGIDATTAMVERATQRAKALGLDNVTFREALATRLPFPDASFDVVTSSNLLLHVPEPGAVLAEASRVLRPGGRLALLEPAAVMNRIAMAGYLRGHRYNPPTAHAMLAWADAAEVTYRHTEDRLTADLGGAGFEVDRRERRMNGLALIWVAHKP
ncbi:flavin reductase [Sorangium sp. So ce1097]|uniref:flavin reductase n=1 Tax=Sorangium sp. So ce1097 TaxID=3133330 RepID=UPI003F6107D1